MYYDPVAARTIQPQRIANGCYGYVAGPLPAVEATPVNLRKGAIY
jgi:hypothetical protein